MGLNSFAIILNHESNCSNLPTNAADLWKAINRKKHKIIFYFKFPKFNSVLCEKIYLLRICFLYESMYVYQKIINDFEILLEN